MAQKSPAAPGTAGDTKRNSQRICCQRLRDIPPGLVAKLMEEIGQLHLAAFQEFDCPPDCVDDPSQDFFACGPGSVALRQLLDEGSFLSVRFGESGLGKDLINGVQKGPAHGVATSLGALSQLDEIINKHIGVS